MATKQYKSLRTFRAQLREAFNAAEAGDIVTITRYGRTFVLVDPTIDDFHKLVLDKVARKELGL